jgi:hypothetical protein
MAIQAYPDVYTFLNSDTLHLTAIKKQLNLRGTRLMKKKNSTHVACAFNS